MVFGRLVPETLLSEVVFEEFRNLYVFAVQKSISPLIEEVYSLFLLKGEFKWAFAGIVDHSNLATQHFIVLLLNVQYFDWQSPLNDPFFLIVKFILIHTLSDFPFFEHHNHTFLDELDFNLARL